MKFFTIDTDNNITFYNSAKAWRESLKPGQETADKGFNSEVTFADAVGNDNPRLLEIWNSLPGVTPVKKFANRKTATERIWKQIQPVRSRLRSELFPTTLANHFSAFRSIDTCSNDRPSSSLAV